MASDLKLPQPGDLITAQDMRDLIGAVLDLISRVSALEQVVPGAGGELAIFDLQWAGTDLHIGDELIILGANLGLEGENRVDFGGLASVMKYNPGSNDNKLVLNVPAMSLGGPSKKMTLTVARPGVGSASREVTIFQGVPTKPDGTINFAPAQFPSGTIAPNANLVLTFPLVITNLNLETTFQITAVATLLTSPAVTMSAVALNDINQVITSITLPRSEQSQQTRTLKLRVSVPPLPAGVTQAAANVAVSLSTPANPELTPASGLIDFTVGAAAPPPGAFSISVIGAQAPGSFDPVTSSLTLPPAQTPSSGYLVQIRADLSSMPAGEAYTVTRTTTDNRWAITGSTGFTLTTPGPMLLSYRITPQSSAPIAKLNLTIAGTNPQHTASVSFTLKPS